MEWNTIMHSQKMLTPIKAPAKETPIQIICYDKILNAKMLSWLKKGSLILLTDPTIYNPAEIMKLTPFDAESSRNADVSRLLSPDSLEEFKELKEGGFMPEYIDNTVKSFFQKKCLRDCIEQLDVLDKLSHVYENNEFTPESYKLMSIETLNMFKGIANICRMSRVNQHILPSLRQHIDSKIPFTLVGHDYDLAMILSKKDFMGKHPCEMYRPNGENVSLADIKEMNLELFLRESHPKYN